MAQLLTEHFKQIGMIARWQPVHLGHVPVLRALCENADHALIGIGSSNVHDYRSPFMLDEVTDMLRLALYGWKNFTLLPVPDLNDGPRWRLMVRQMFGTLDCFVTDNPYVMSLMSKVYRAIRPINLVAESDRVAVDGSMVRREMARGNAWKRLVPQNVADYITANNLDKRFRGEFGLQTLALDAIILASENKS